MGKLRTAVELREMGFIPEADACKALGLPEWEMLDWDYIKSEQRGADGQNWVLLRPEAQRVEMSPALPSPESLPSLPARSASGVENQKSKIKNPTTARRPPDLETYRGFLAPEELRAKGWIQEKEALKLLGLQKGEDFDWFDFDYIDTVQWGADGQQWVLLLPEVAARLQGTGSRVQGSGKTPVDPTTQRPNTPIQNRKSKIENGKSRKRRKPADPSLFPERKRIPSKRGRWGERPILISVEEAAARLGWSVSYTRRQMRWRYIQRVWDRDGKLCAVLQSVEWWLSAHADSKARRAAAREKKERWRMEGLSAQPPHSPSDIGHWSLAIGHSPSDPVEGQRVWHSVRRAAWLLGVTVSQVHKYIRAGKLTKRQKRAGTKVEVPWDEVDRLMQAREAAKSRRHGFSPTEWGRMGRKPVVRSLNDVPERVQLIPFMEAAGILGVTPGTLRKYLRRGRLFYWQNEPRKQGSRVYLNYHEVMRYATDPDRLERSARARRKSAESAPNEWEEARGIEPKETSSFTERDYGDFYTGRQVMRLLGISRATLNDYRRDGRLKGYQRPLKPGRYERRRWWFYLKLEVHALKEDAGYRKKSASYRRSQTPEAKDARLMKFFEEPPYAPHAPNPYWERQRRIEKIRRESE